MRSFRSLHAFSTNGSSSVGGTVGAEIILWRIGHNSVNKKYKISYTCAESFSDIDERTAKKVS
jgi:hypothetical protein